MAGITVEMTREEFDAAWKIGEDRHRHHCARKGVAALPRGLEEEGRGAVGEFAVARLVGGQWNAEVGAMHYGAADVVNGCGDTLEVKATEWKTGRLLIYNKTEDTLPVILAVVDREAHRVRIAGWITAADGKRSKWWEASFRIPCWAVPQSDLRRIEELPCLAPLFLSPS